MPEKDEDKKEACVFTGMAQVGVMFVLCRWP